MQLHAGDAPDQAVGDAGGEFALQSSVLALMAPAAHQVIALPQFGQQHRDVGRIVLQVAIEAHDHLALGDIKPGGHRGGLAVVLAQQHRHQFRDLPADLLQDLSGSVAGAVVDQHQFETFAAGSQRLKQLLHQMGQAFLLVVEGHHHGQVQGCAHASGSADRCNLSRPAAGFS